MFGSSYGTAKTSYIRRYPTQYACMRAHTHTHKHMHKTHKHTHTHITNTHKTQKHTHTHTHTHKTHKHTHTHTHSHHTHTHTSLTVSPVAMTAKIRKHCSLLMSTSSRGTFRSSCVSSVDLNPMYVHHRNAVPTGTCTHHATVHLHNNSRTHTQNSAVPFVG